MKLTKRQLRNLIREAIGTATAPVSGEKKSSPNNLGDIVLDTLPPPAKGKRQDKQDIDPSSYTGATREFYWLSSPPSAALSAANKEAKLWEGGEMLSDERKKKLKRGYMLEGDKEAYEVLKKYWDHTGTKRWHQHSRVDSQGKKKQGTAWSAAFVSWCMSHSDGEGPKWDVSINHQNPSVGGYLHKAWERRKAVEANPEKYIGQTLYLAFSGKEIIGNNKSNKFSTIKPDKQIATKDNNISPGDVVGIRQGGGGIHMDIYAGGGKKIGGNTYNGQGVANTSGLQPAKLEKITDVIKRVKIVKKVEKTAATANLQWFEKNYLK